MTASHLDVWLIASGRVYQAVPYEVVADWLQQGRVVAADRVRPAGGGTWQPVGEIAPLAVYLPAATPNVPNDRAEALQPVELGIEVRRGRDTGDEDVDMVPLIDISLVLLIFFMMTSTVSVGGANIPVPETRFATLTADRTMLWVGADLGPDSTAVYSIGVGQDAPATGDTNLSLGDLVGKIRTRLREREAGQVIVARVAAHQRLPIEVVQKLTAELTKLKPLGLSDIKAEVTEQPR